MFRMSPYETELECTKVNREMLKGRIRISICGVGFAEGSLNQGSLQVGFGWLLRYMSKRC